MYVDSIQVCKYIFHSFFNRSVVIDMSDSDLVCCRETVVNIHMGDAQTSIGCQSFLSSSLLCRSIFGSHRLECFGQGFLGTNPLSFVHKISFDDKNVFQANQSRIFRNLLIFETSKKCAFKTPSTQDLRKFFSVRLSQRRRKLARALSLAVAMHIYIAIAVGEHIGPTTISNVSAHILSLLQISDF